MTIPTIGQGAPPLRIHLIPCSNIDYLKADDDIFLPGAYGTVTVSLMA